MALVTRNEGAKVNSNINVTPMVDVMLCLLIIFMVITPMVQNKVNVNLPKADQPITMPDAEKEDQVMVAITRDGRVYIGAEQTTSDDLGKKVADKLENKTSKEIYMRADARAQYGKVTEVIDSVRTAGVDQIGLLVDQRQDLTPIKK